MKLCFVHRGSPSAQQSACPWWTSNKYLLYGLRKEGRKNINVKVIQGQRRKESVRVKKSAF